MTFPEAENFLYSLANLPRKEYMSDASQCNVYLKRLQFFLDILGNPEKQIPHYIHVTGTSGKGSTVHFLHSILQSAGKRVASTTSPHPTIVTERWKIGNTFMSKKEFVEIMETMRPALDEYIRASPYDVLPYFEITAAIALYYFAKKKVDWAILEVGCGGMYDATNIIPYKDAAVITNIGLDHTGLLGKTKSEIAKRKSGIITGKTKVFTSEQSPKIRKIIEDQARITKSTFQHSQVNKLASIQVNTSGTSFVYKGTEYHTSAIGRHQANNAALAIDLALSLGIKQSAIQKGITNAKQPLRMEVVSEKPFIILDGAHNPDKVASTIATLQQIAPNKRIHILNGYSGNKNLTSIIKKLAELHPVSIACTRNTINHFRKVASPTDLVQLWKKASPQAVLEQFLDPAAAMAWSKKQAKKNDVILVTGSLFVASEVRATL